jgi:hypothetical protein
VAIVRAHAKGKACTVVIGCGLFAHEHRLVGSCGNLTHSFLFHFDHLLRLRILSTVRENPPKTCRQRRRIFKARINTRLVNLSDSMMSRSGNWYLARHLTVCDSGRLTGISLPPHFNRRTRQHSQLSDTARDDARAHHSAPDYNRACIPFAVFPFGPCMIVPYELI